MFTNYLAFIFLFKPLPWLILMKSISLHFPVLFHGASYRGANT